MTQVTTPVGTFCGSTVRIAHGTLVLKTAAGEVTVDLARASSLRASSACP
jgi:3-mercaptopyruvate sulfurtransferase SseA